MKRNFICLLQSIRKNKNSWSKKLRIGRDIRLKLMDRFIKEKRKIMSRSLKLM